MPNVRVLLVANRTAADQPLVDAVRRRTHRGSATFHLLVPAMPNGLHRVVDPEVAGREEARQRLERALDVLSEAAGLPVTGHVGDANPLAAVQDALHLHGYDEIILSTLPWRISRWMRLDLPRKIAALGVPVEHVTLTAAVQPDETAQPDEIFANALSTRRRWLLGARCCVAVGEPTRRSLPVEGRTVQAA